VVLERLSEAKRRGRTPLAEWRGGIHLSDPSSLLRGDRTGETIAETIRRLLRQTGTPADEIDGVSLHGTGTLENDLAEGRGVRAALNPRKLAAFSLKGAIGHLLGGAGSVETVAGILALRDQVIPPTVNLVEPDPECLPEAVQSLPQRRLLRNLLKLSLGFGGHVAALQFQRWQG
jgi:3-oxoacyl-(acyl-carrier-protein) synthase